MADLFVSPVIEKLIDACFEYFKDQVRWQTGMQEELQKLQNILPQIQAVVFAYSQVEIKDPALNKWYWQLRDAIDEADDVLDEIEYRKLQKQASKNKKAGKVRSLMKSIKRRTVEISKRALKIDSCLKRLEGAVQQLNEISTEVSKFLHLVDRTKQEQRQQQLELQVTRETGSLIKNVLLGRIKEMEFITQWLRNPNHTQSSDTTDLYRNISLLSVVGHAGMGKTTLLQQVYKDATLLQNVNKDGITEGFHIKMWACVSTNFNAKTVIKNLLESLIKERPNLETIEALQSRLESEVKNKSFILVLDDIWEADEEKWKNVFAALRDGNSGSKVLISTRIPSVASIFANMIKNNQMLQLEGMEKDDCLQLFNTHAFAGGKNPGGKFGDIAEKMVEKLVRCPLAIKFIGDFLKTCIDETFWTNVLNTNIGNVKLEEPSQNYLLPILKLSYTNLPSHLQICFSFCCIFPQDYEFDKDDLVRMWIAVGFIQSFDIPEETLENTGRRYFNILVQKSFFEEFHTHDRVYYKLHDLLHELAQSVSIEECFRVVGDKKLSIPQTIRHLSIDAPSLEVSKEMKKFKHLRSLLLTFSEFAEFDKEVISQIVKASKSIRLFVIYTPWYIYVPKTIDRLIHLRYLKVDTEILKLSRCSHLYHLQFVISKRLENLVMNTITWEELRPNKNCNLIIDELVIRDLSELLMEPQRSISYLRFLSIEHNDKLVSFPSETELWFLKHSSTILQLKFENLKSLQSLPSLSTFSSLTYLTLKDIPLIKSLPDLPSSLKMLELNYLKSLESLPSSLSAISALQTIELREIFLLKSLPDLPSSLKRLELNKFGLLRSLPSSLSAISALQSIELKHIPLLKSLPDLPSSIKKLELYKLKSLESLPSSLSAISSLDTLHLSGIPLVKSLPDLPSSMKRLVISFLESLQCLPSSLSVISSLQTLGVRHIPLLKSLPDLPSSLKKLNLHGLKSLESLPSSLSAISSLETLEVWYIPLLKSLPDLPSSLKNLELFQFESLESLPSSLSAISSLETLTVRRIPLLKSLPDLPSSLKELALTNVESLQCLPSSLSAISSLETLEVRNVPLLKSLPDLPSSLKKLELYDFNSLQCLPSSLPAISSLETIVLYDIPLLKSLPDLPSSLKELRLHHFKSLQCLPSSLSAISSLEFLKLEDIPLLKSLPDLPSSLKYLYIVDCDRQLMKRYKRFIRVRLFRLCGEAPLEEEEGCVVRPNVQRTTLRRWNAEKQ